MTTRRRRLALAATATLLAVVACRARSEEEVETSNPVAVTVARAYRGTLRSLVEASGVIAPAPGAELIVLAPGSVRIAELPHAVGDRVRRGELLVRFEAPTLEADADARRADVKRGEARVAATRAELDRLSQLFERGVAARKEVEDARRDQADAEAELASAKSALTASVSVAARAVVHAPFDGVVTSRSHNPGDLVEESSGDPVLRLVDLAHLEVQAAVPLASLGDIAVGERARLSAAGLPPGARATVVARAAVADAATGTGTVRLAIAEPTRAPVGSTVAVAIETVEHRDVTIIPLAAVVQEGEQSFVYVVTPDHVAHRRPLVAGIVADGEVEVRSGVEPNEPVIVAGQNALPDGAAVSPTEQGTSAGPATAGGQPGSGTPPR